MARRSPTLDMAGALAAAFEDPLPVEEDPARSAALDATLELLTTRGLRGWSVDDVAARAGVARATIYRHFDGRDGLVAEVVTREARRFFAAVAARAMAGAPYGSLDAMVAEGILAGLELIGAGPLGRLLRDEPASAMSLLASERFLAAATAALAGAYDAMTAPEESRPCRRRSEVAAETLVRLGLSFVLVPGPTSALDRDEARRRLASMVRPLLAAPHAGTSGARFPMNGTGGREHAPGR